MNVWQKCSDTKDAVPLYRPHGLYLKPVALLHISVQLPQLKAYGKVTSDWDLMEKIKHWTAPEEFTTLKVSKKTLEFVRFDAEIQNKSKLPTVLSRLDGRLIKISGFNEALKVRAVEAKGDFPTKHDWDSFFRDAKDMNEMKAGERPDTVYLSNLPCKWFSSGTDCDKPTERLIKKIFEQFGEIKRIDIPMLDAYRNKMNNSISGVKLFTFNKNIIFEVYIQFKEYFCFVKCMDAFRGMKLVHIDESKNAFSASIKVDFDKSKHLSDASIHRRQIVRERLMKKEKETMENEMKRKKEEESRLEQERLQKIERRKLREQKRKEKQLEKLKLKEVDDMSKKIATEEHLLLMAQRKLESIRLLGELLNRIKNDREKQVAAENKTKRNKRLNEDGISNDNIEATKTKNNCSTTELDAEKDLRYKLIQMFKEQQQRKIVKEKVKLRALATDGSNSSHKPDNALFVSSESDTERLDNRVRFDDPNSDRRYRQGRQWTNNYRGGRSRDRPFFSRSNVTGEDFQNSRGRFHRGRRGFGGRSTYPHSWRGQFQGHMMMPLMDPVMLTYSHEYYKYLQKIARDSRSTRSGSSRSYSRSRSRSRSKSRSRSCSSRSRSRSRSYSRSYSRRRSSSRSNSRSWSRSRSRTRSCSADRSRDKLPEVLSRIESAEKCNAVVEAKKDPQVAPRNGNESSSTSKDKSKKSKKHVKKKKAKKSKR